MAANLPDSPGARVMNEVVVDIDGLNLSFPTAGGPARILADIRLRIHAGESIGIIGESGSGKTTLAYAMVGWLQNGRVTGHATVCGVAVTAATPAQLTRLRGNMVAFVPQDPARSLDPTMRIGRQVQEQIGISQPSLSRRQAEARVLELFHQVGLPEPEAMMRRFPHQLSGGQQQRVMIAAALSANPRLIIFDEPTTGLDATTATRILALINELRAKNHCACLFISHDLASVARVSDRVYVMRRGEVLESGPVRHVFAQPRHEYTRRLIDTLRAPAQGRDDADSTDDGAPALSVRQLGKRYSAHARAGQPDALSDISFSLQRGQTLSVIGQSGSGKTTLIRAVTGIIAPSGGEVRLAGETLAPLTQFRTERQRRAIQLVFQNPDASLNPRHTVREIIQRPMALYRTCAPSEYQARVDALLQAVQLPVAYGGRHPRQLSGGEKQRVAIARALAADPEVIVCDEPTSALDISVQHAVLELLLSLQKARRIACLFITHDLNVVRKLGGDVMVINQGRCVEQGPVSRVFAAPRDEFTRALLGAVPPIESILADKPLTAGCDGALP